MPVQSVITSPSAGDILSAAKRGSNTIFVKGFAWGGGGSGVNRVDVSLNDGEDFTRASMLEKPIKQRRRSEWSWVFFEKEIPIPDDVKAKIKKGEAVDLTLTSKALNSAWNVQPRCAKIHWSTAQPWTHLLFPTVDLCPHANACVF